VTDADVSALTTLGLSEDAVFEITVAAAMGAATERLDAGLAMLDSSGSDDAPA
jgi:alkylhydroperoxidase family enzyme